MKYDILEFCLIEKDVRGERNESRYLETESEGAQTFFSTIKYTLLRFFSLQFNWKRNQWRAEQYYWEFVFDFTRNTICSSCNGTGKNIIKPRVSVFFFFFTWIYPLIHNSRSKIKQHNIYASRDNAIYQIHC